MAMLTIVILAYQMNREIPRTIRSALPDLQSEVSATDYEILVIDNGSKDALDITALDTRGVKTQVVRIQPEDASSSPVSVLNWAIENFVRTELVMVCIDGARMLSKELITRSIRTVLSYPNAVALTASRHLGPDLQFKSMLKGYDQSVEDRLLASVNWEADLDLLFDVSVPAGAHQREWPIAQNESNAFTMTVLEWKRLGGYNEGFSAPGGGLCNLEIFDRIIAREGAPSILLCGEATFHQFHGGAATSDGTYFKRWVHEYERVTGRPYQRPGPKFLIDLNTSQDRILPERTGIHAL